MKPFRPNFLKPLVLLLAACLPLHAPAAAEPINVDFVAVLNGVRFDPVTVDGNGGGGHAVVGNGLLDAAEMALVAAVLRDPSLDLSARGGVRHAEVAAAWQQARASAAKDLAPLLAQYPTAAEMVAGYAMVGTKESFESIAHMMTMFGAPLKGDYTLSQALGRHFGPDGDADGDGSTNRQEYAAFKDGGTAAYVAMALDPAKAPAVAAGAAAAAPAAPPKAKRKNVGVVLYPGFEVLDVFGPVEMWGYIPDFNVVFIAEQAGPVPSAQGVEVVAPYSFATAPALDILMVPGGFGTMAQLENAALMDYLRKSSAGAEYTTSVCTGSALLARAGLLDGKRATSNKRFFSLAAAQDPDVKWVVAARWVEDGKVFTSSGVSAGTDMALALVARLYGREQAEALASSVEYVWEGKADDDPFAQFADWPKKK